MALRGLLGHQFQIGSDECPLAIGDVTGAILACHNQEIPTYAKFQHILAF